MAGLCEGGNEAPGSLKASKIGDIEMVFGQMMPMIRHRLPDIRLTVGKTSEKTQLQSISGICRVNRRIWEESMTSEWAVYISAVVYCGLHRLTAAKGRVFLGMELVLWHDHSKGIKVIRFGTWNVTKMDLREVRYDDREWVNLAQDRDRWRAYVRAAMSLRVP
ncbi:hypothetical protein ANN_21906 [Periplaneta americana]|uniref:Uncharacterized protein n=1 Tax=Periplaneta americana TaxID=6978 RepID=A0ABQ8S6N9_PERAM|nr:hypothetical protein ANN_21906 [Periplaneta americana]